MKINALTQMKVKNLEKGKHNDGQGLWLHKNHKHGGKWVLRIFRHGRRREMGLGRWPEVSIAEAREKAGAARRSLRDGKDPIDVRAAERRSEKRVTLGEAVQRCFAAKQAELKDDGKAGRWMSPLEVHILPKLGDTAVEAIDQHEVKRVLDPIWHKKPEAAVKALNRINLTLKHAAAMGLDVDLQATMKARALLGKQRRTTKHIPSLPYPEAPKFYQWLCTKDLMSCYALRFLILTVARSSEVRFATYDEIDGDVWTLPPERTKTGIEHRIPLTDEAQRVIELARRSDDQTLLFPSPRGKPLSDAAMARFLDREGYDARPHGFRATFRTWVEEQTDTEFEVKEAALGHQVDGAVVRAYQRSDRLEKRAVAMLNWSKLLQTEPN